LGCHVLADDDLEDSRDYFEGDVLGDVFEDDLVNTSESVNQGHGATDGTL
jgi:hypothetical protein